MNNPSIQKAKTIVRSVSVVSRIELPEVLSSTEQPDHYATPNELWLGCQASQLSTIQQAEVPSPEIEQPECSANGHVACHNYSMLKMMRGLIPLLLEPVRFPG